VTAQPHALVRFRRAIERRALWMAEDAARELPNLPLEDALQLLHLYAERGSPSRRRRRSWLQRLRDSPAVSRSAWTSRRVSVPVCPRISWLEPTLRASQNPRHMFPRLVRPRITHGLTRFVAVAFALTGFAAIVGVIVAMLGAAGSYRDAVAGTMWLIGFIAVVVVAGQLWGQILAWGIDESDTPESESFASFILIPAGVVVMAIGTIVYVLF